MSLKYPVGSGGGDYEPIPAGSHIAVCDIVADLGLQPGSGLYPNPKNQVFIRFELPNERIEFEKDGKKQTGPAVIGKIYTASMNEKANLRHHLESWRGKAFTDEQAASFDIDTVLGKPCMITVMHTKKGDKTYANIVGVGPIPKGINAKTIIPEITPVLYTPESTKQTYALLPEWIRKKIDGQIIKETRNVEAQQTGNKLDDGTYITDADLPPNWDDADAADDQSVPF
jgi:hypothetical protein